jgi:hypothetical protein
MGLRVPAGTHQVRLRFRPVLVWVGTVLAMLVLSGAWLLVIIRAWSAAHHSASTSNSCVA